MNEPAVSVLVPAYNVAPFIGDCLASVRAQTFTAWECIVVDDGSTDGTDDLVCSLNDAQGADARIRLIRQPNAGVSPARNLALAHAKGRCVLFLDGDDLLHPTALSRLCAALDAAPAYAAAYGTFRKILENGAPYPGQKPLPLQRYPTGDVLAKIMQENFLANGGHILVRADLARRLGGFNTALRLSEDWEFWCRLAAEGPFLFIGNTPEISCLRLREGSSSGLLSGQWENHLRSIEAVLGNAALQAKFSASEWRKITRRTMASHLWEGGRVNFTARRFADARALMLRSLALHPHPRRIALFALAQLSQALNISLVSRLRFNDHDRALAHPTDSTPS